MTSFQAARYTIDRIGEPECIDIVSKIPPPRPDATTPRPVCGIIVPSPASPPPTVFVNNFPAAELTAIGTTHRPCCCGPTCQCQTHCSTLFIPPTGSKTVFIGNSPALRFTDFAICGHTITTGSIDVFFG